jgi:FtsP/CotA-like multicopper oxidase with cupredoxin domain/cation diffusion facilitator CzcD-associated flavoprotein CzcO
MTACLATGFTGRRNEMPHSHPHPREAPETASTLEVVVVGAGQTGLAIGHYLAQQGRSFVILEAAGSIGAAWRERWDSLTLFTPRRYNGLPGFPFPGNPEGYPGRDEVIAYLERYAETFELPIELNSRVHKLAAGNGAYVLDVDGRTLAADQVVVATGPFQAPFVPEAAWRLDPAVFQTHSTGYRRPEDVPGEEVLVVGGGNTGFQIAKELAATHRVHLSVGSRQTPLPQRLLGRDLFWWLTKSRLLSTTVDSPLGRRMQGRDTLIGSTPRELRRRYGVELKPRLVEAAGRTVSFADGSELEVAAVVWATGYRPDYSWIDLPVFDADGRLVHRRGVTEQSGLYFLGLTWQHTRGSALLGWVKDDAEFIAREIDAHAQARFPREPAGLVESTAPEVVELADGESFDLEIAPVAKQIAAAEVRMLAYNGSIPGPTLKVRAGSTVAVNVANHGDLETTVHWHGLRLENRYDGTHDTQAPIPVGERFTYLVHVPDPGVYWYHPHIREDYGQELGLYGNILAVPEGPDYWPAVNRELLLTLDDVLLEHGRIAPFSRTDTTHVAMGRFGNVMLVAGEPDLALEAHAGEVVRLYLTNTANTRVFNVALPGARMKLVGGDSGRYEHEAFVDEVLLAPSERAVVDVLFGEPGRLTLEHRTPDRSYPLAEIAVTGNGAKPPLGQQFEVLRGNPELAAERERIAPFLERPPDKTLAFVAEMELGTPEGPVAYVCPMHPEVTSDTPDRCPKCGMKLVPQSLAGESGHGHEHGHEAHGHHGQGHTHEAPQGIEWEDDMVEVNRMTTPTNMRWKLVDRETGAENAAIDWRFRVGEQVKIRLINELDSDHPMPHPFHVHGAGRFLILARDGVTEPNLVWKDTVLVRTGETVDILLDVTNPGVWMAHCHIAEHHESGMMLSFTVDES